MHNFKQWLQLNENWIDPQPPWGWGGWKIHLRTGTDNETRDRAYEIVQEIIARNGNKWPSKKLGGGEPDEKDITIYCGPKSEANKAAKAIAGHFILQLLLKRPSDEMWKDDVEILPGTDVYGRFNASPLEPMTGAEYHQYGCNGHSMLKSYMARIRTPNFNKANACWLSKLHLYNKLGSDFLDKPPEKPPVYKKLGNNFLDKPPEKPQ
jgi:hypothetical protein